MPASARLRPKGPLPDALREWADWVYLQARLSAKTGRAMHPNLTTEGEAADWRTYCGQRERRLIEAAMAVGIWQPDLEIFE